MACKPATRQGHLFKPAVCQAPNLSTRSASLSKATFAATHLFLPEFKPAVCRAPNLSNPSASLSKATLAATHLFLPAFKPAVCRAPNLSNPSASLSKGNSRNYTSVFTGVQACRLPGPLPGPKALKPFSRSYTPGPSVFNGVQPSRLPGPKPFKATLFLQAFKPAVCRAPNPSNPPAGLSKPTLAATRHGHLFVRAFNPAPRHGHLFLQAFKPAAGPQTLQTLPQAFPRQLSQPHMFLRAFKPAVCRAPNPSNLSASLSKPTLEATRQGHLFLTAFKPAVCRAPKPFKPFREPFQGNSRSYTPRPPVFNGATRYGHLFVWAFKPATRHGQLFLQAFKRAVCRAPNPSNLPAGLSKAPLAATREGHLFSTAFSCLPGPKPSNPFRRPF